MESTTFARKKVYVTVNVDHRPDGTARPNRIVFENGRSYEIDRVKSVRRAAATKVGGTGIRYTIWIRGKERKLFEDEDRWFVEEIILPGQRSRN